MPILADEEAGALDDLNAMPGSCIRRRETMVVLDAFSAEYLREDKKDAEVFRKSSRSFPPVFRSI